MKRKQQHTTKEKIIKLIIECVIVLAFVALLRNDCVEAAMDNVVLLENRRPGYFKWLSSRAVGEETEDGSVTVYPVSKLYLSEITTDDLNFLKKYTKNTGKENNLIYFLDGTGYDVETGEYGSVQNWEVVDGEEKELSEISYEEKPIQEITDIYAYLSELKGHDFIISVKDDAAYTWNDELQKQLEGLGLHGGFGTANAYIAVVRDGTVVYEQVSAAPLEYQEDGLYILSSGVTGTVSTTPGDSIIKIDDTDYSVKGRGMNIVVTDDGSVIDSVNFNGDNTLYNAVRMEG